MWALLKLVPRQVWFGLAATAVLTFLCWRIYAAGANSRDEEVAGLQTQVAGLQTQIDALTSSLQTAQDANASNLATIEILRADNRAFADAAQVNQSEAAAAVQRLESRNAKLQEDLAASRNERQRLIEGNDYAKRWSESSVPAVLRDQLLRDYGTETSHQDGNGPLRDAGFQGAARARDETRFRAASPLPDAVHRGRFAAYVLQLPVARLDRPVGRRAADG